jgi:hypothetical protein
MRFFFSTSAFGDPGPCPVDDAPHTTCTSPDYTGASAPIVIPQMPCRDALPRPAMTLPPVTLQPGEFTTATYRRAAHGRKRGSRG